MRKRAWYAVNIRAQSERLAVANLERQGFHTFLPIRLKTIRHARQFRKTTAPLFPGYLFIELDLSVDRWRSINGTFGVVSLVMAGSEPIALPQGVVEALIAMSGQTGLVRFDQDLAVGQRVRLLAGPFAEQIGTLEQLNDAGRVRVLLEMMGTYVPVRLTAEQLLPA